MHYHEIIGQLARFGIVGCLAVAVNYGVYCMLLPFLSHNLSYTVGYVISLCINYLLTTAFTFKAQRSVSNGIGFAVCHAINYLMQIGLLNFYILVGFSKTWAPLPVYFICVPTNFLLVRFVMKRYGKNL